jgi:predicted phosphodiesterase
VALQKARLQATLPTSLTTTIEGFRIALCRGDDMPLVNRWSKSGEFDYIFYGHSLRRTDSVIGKTRVINPGALGGPRYQSRSGCLLDLVSGEAKLIEVPGRVARESTEESAHVAPALCAGDAQAVPSRHTGTCG